MNRLFIAATLALLLTSASPVAADPDENCDQFLSVPATICSDAQPHLIGATAFWNITSGDAHAGMALSADISNNVDGVKFSGNVTAEPGL